MKLMLVALGFLLIPGALFNNLNNSGLVVSQTQSIGNCDNKLDICQITGNVGCQSNPNFCTLQGQTASFLSGSSPFTQLLQGNLFALFTNLNPLGGASSSGSQTSWSGTHGPFDLTGNPIYYGVDCIGTQNGSPPSGSQTNWAPGHCTQTNTDGSNMTETQVATMTNWNTNWNSSVQLQIFNLGNATYQFGCNWIAQVNYTLLGNSGYTYFGCTVSQPTLQFPSNPTHLSWAMLLAMPVSFGPTGAGSTHIHMFLQPENWFTQDCLPNTKLLAYSSIGCQTFLNGFKGYTIPGTAVNFVPNTAGAIVFGLIVGLILLIGGLGLQIGFGGGVSAGTNRQGTKLFQVLGLGLIIWSFMFSEFGTWFSSGILPYGLDGTFGIIGASITAMFFFGAYSVATDS